MNKRVNSRKKLRDPLKKIDRQAYRRAFGEPDAEFHDRIRDTLFLIKEKEEEPVKKKMTFSMAFALVMCFFIVTAAFAGSALLGTNPPDNTLDPLSQSQNTSAPMPTPMPAASDALYYRSGDMGFYHKWTKCFAGRQNIPTTKYDISRLYLTACPYCVFDTVYCMEGSVLYHKTADCTAFGEHDLTATKFETVKSKAKTACPICIASNCIFWQEGDEYTTYHLRICEELENIPDHSAAVQGTVADARACGRNLCETCRNSAVLYSPNQRSISHLDEDCINEENAEWIPLDSALSKDAYICVLCMDNMYYCAPENGFYHRDCYCSAINGSSLMLLSEEDAVSSGRTLCPDCDIGITPPPTIPNKVLPTATPMSAAPTSFSMPTATSNTVAADSNTVTVYVDDGGIHYHTDYKCSGMTNPKKWQYYSVAEALNMGRTACQICMYAPTAMPMPTSTSIASEPRTVYFVENGGIHYHIDSTCSGMKNPQLGTVAQALNLGKTACPTCINVSPTPVPIYDMTSVYMTDYNGIYYHLDENCMNMVGAYAVAFEYMHTEEDRPPCPLCTFSIDNAEALVYVWSKEGESYYHTDQSCGGTLGKSRIMVRVALNRRQTPCPTCISPNQYTETYYYRADGTFYHADKSCSLVENCELLSGLLAQVQALGRTPCPNCYEPSSTDITYYAAPAAHSYHTQFACAVSASSQQGYPLPSDKSESAITFADIFEPSGKYYAHMLEACSDCVLAELGVLAESVSASSAAQLTDPRVPMMSSEVMEAPESAPRAITINALDFDRDSVGTCSDLAVNFNCDILTMHSTIMMHSRGAVYTEFEFTLNDPSIDPDTIRIVPYCEESGSLGCLWAEVQEIHYDNGETGYLLCQMMNSPSLEYGADCFRLYVGDQMMAEFR